MRERPLLARWAPRCAAAVLAGFAALASLPASAASPPAAAEGTSAIVILPVVIADGKALRPPRLEDGELGRAAASLDALLADTAHDLGLAVAAPGRGTTRLRDADLLERARVGQARVVLPSLRVITADEIEVRLVMAEPGATAVVERSGRVARADLEVRAVVLLRDLAIRGRPPNKPPLLLPGPGLPAQSSVGRITLLANVTVFGGLAGYSIERASGSDDPRLLFPLMVIGAGIGLGAGLIASGEWEVTPASAWYASAGIWWPTAASHLIYQGRFAATRPETDRWAFGLLGGTAGITVASLGLTLGPMTDGGAVIAHSGGGLGMLFGSLGQILASGTAREVPYSGMGYGAGLAWLAAAAVATQVDVPPSRILAVDLGVIGGALVGGGAASPLLLGKDDPARQRAWAGITLGTALAGGTVVGLLYRPKGPPKKLAGLPLLGVLGESNLGPLHAPIVGAGWAGSM